MSGALWEKYSKEELMLILNESRNWSDLIAKLGYHSRSSATQKQIRKMIDFYGFELPAYVHEGVYKTQYKTCPICGEKFKVDDFAQQRRKYCANCSPATNNPSIVNKAMKTRVVELRGGKCEKCGYDKCIDALEFHHIDPSTKDMSLANTGACPSFERYLAEAAKCLLLCANCHREEHWRLRQINQAEK